MYCRISVFFVYNLKIKKNQQYKPNIYQRCFNANGVVIVWNHLAMKTPSASNRYHGVMENHYDFTVPCRVEPILCIGKVPTRVTIKS